MNNPLPPEWDIWWVLEREWRQWRREMLVSSCNELTTEYGATLSQTAASRVCRRSRIKSHEKNTARVWTEAAWHLALWQVNNAEWNQNF